ncbi:MAG: bifunctional phosphopantothenoylcysteine decarboxylase/phosphopantothenate--cysteine ligase CoaBC [Acidobacteriota bacterium]
MNKIVLGVSSSISIYKSCEIIRSFQEKGYEVQVVMTKNAAKLVSPVLFKALTGYNVMVDLFEEGVSDHVMHIQLAKEAVLFVVAPATANVIGKMASGIADDFVTTLYTAASCPVVIAPAMNEKMYLNRKTQQNIEYLKTLGVRFIEPEKGYLACQDEGYGRLASVEKIVDESLLLIKKRQSLKGTTVLVTGGPTREYLDSVRFLTNRSSGKMGYELAAEAERRGARTLFISGPSRIIPQPGIESIKVETAEEMDKQVTKHLEESDIVIMAAAVSDFKFSKKNSRKIKKDSMPSDIRLIQTHDILEKTGKNKEQRILVGFAAESNDIEQNAKRKLKQKNLDMIVANDVSKREIGFESDLNDVTIIHRDGKIVRTGKKSKLEISQNIMDEIEGIIERRMQ